MSLPACYEIGNALLYAEQLGAHVGLRCEEGAWRYEVHLREKSVTGVELTLLFAARAILKAFK